MRQFILVFFVFIPFMGFTQVEFFGNSTGISTSFIQCLYPDQINMSGGGIDAYFKNGLSLGAGVESVGSQAFPIVSFSYFMKSDDEKVFPSGAFGFSFAQIDEFSIVGFNLGAMHVFLKDTKFPFSLFGSISIQALFAKKEYGGKSMIPILSLDYRQAFFSNLSIYPFIGLSGGFMPSNNSKTLMSIIGLNFKLGRPSANTQIAE